MSPARMQRLDHRQDLAAQFRALPGDMSMKLYTWSTFPADGARANKIYFHTT